MPFLDQLNPVSFTWNKRELNCLGNTDIGFIAQDLQEAQINTNFTIPGLVYDVNPEKLEASYGKLIPVLVKAIQELKAEIQELKKM